MLGIRLTRRNSLTNTSAVQNIQIVQKQQPQGKRTTPCVASSSFSAQPSYDYDCAEDYMCYDADERTNERTGGLKLGSIGSRVSACALTRAESRKSNSSHSGAPMRRNQSNTKYQVNKY